MKTRTNTASATQRDGQFKRLLRQIEKAPFPEDGLNKAVLKVAHEANQEYSTQLLFLLDHGYTEQDVSNMISRARRDGLVRLLGNQV